MMRPLTLAIAAGGAIGSVARYCVSMVAMAAWPQLPMAGTLIANTLGSFLVGFIVVWAARRQLPPLWSGMLVIGFCGGFTTFSLFTLEVASLVSAGEWSTAFAYCTASTILWLVSTWAGWTVGERLMAGSK